MRAPFFARARAPFFAQARSLCRLLCLGVAASSLAFSTASVAAGEEPASRRAPASQAVTSTSARPAAPKTSASEPAPGREEVRPRAARGASGPAGAAADAPERSPGAGATPGSATQTADANAASAAVGDDARLEWRAPAACPTRADVLWHVGNLADSQELRWRRFERIRAGVERRGAGWGLALEFVASGGIRRRTMTSAHCADLAEAAAVAIVLALRTDAAPSDDWQALNASTAARASEPELAPPPALPEPAEPLREPAVADADAESEPLTIAAEAEAVIDPNTLGPAALGASAGVSLGLGRFSTALYAAAFPSATTELGASQSVALALWTGGLRGCYRWGRGLDACALMELGRVSAEGVGLVRASEARDVWATPGLSVAFTAVPFEGWGITTRLSAFHPLVRGRYRVDEGTTVHHLPAVGFRAALGIHVPFL
jgi:hypothetical protein